MQGTDSTPYNNQGKYAFWRTAVASIELGQEEFTQLHQIDIAIKNPRISSIGSCFAQHVGKWLNSGGYQFNQSKLETNQISSFAFGNLYTPRCLLQWFDMGDNDKSFDINSAVYTHNSIYFDLLRPSFNPEGFDSQAELVTARLAASNEMRKTILATDLLVFTLGLTEAWKDNSDVYYPSCPGVVSGLFDDSIYTFHNFSYEEIRTDLEEIATRLKSINPQIQIILTVSPVPLTATMTNKHIMVANQHSKSLLRTVAGFLSDNHVDFSYFPSYEIITVPGAGDFRFEKNLRSVTPQAVNYVMQHFRSVIDKTTHVISPQEKTVNTLQSGINVSSSDEVVCEDELLEAAMKLQVNPTQQQKIDISLFGDSHMGKLSTAFSKIDIQHCGGMVMNGSGFSQKKFAMCDAEYFVPLESAVSRKLWSRILNNLNNHLQDKTTANSTIITNLGMQTHQNISRFSTWLEQTYPEGVAEITTKEFVDYFNDDLTDQLSILLKLHNHGHRVIVVSDPPFCQYFKESKSMTNIIYSYFYAMEYVWSQLGITFFNAAAIFDQEVSDPQSYLSDIEYDDGNHDWIHGNDKYYTWLAEKLLTLVNQD
ncbi:GSCFA domain-containing protein [Shewanella sp. D64]|uniref:GSCFA domain-containing protein n=1 Tax=unclassified Shewanella TaxID=196818 RepID=UPI0022BA6E98|nr:MULTISPECIES: GSCFA domain-containing protein [unclassified Shewanella]MEC4726540.1 GSCFA domain-containing protein [Shewanella sp. D64]MEC4737419.1 GSCFA domain-containing protein [Shewanella sp. E94]WBJ97238.1 GSCFA domain-containing protein [Shewanella sp. MTB7]